MIKTNYLLSRKLNEFRKFAVRLNRMIRSGAFYLLSAQKRSMLLSRMVRLYKQLLGFESKARLKYILAGAAALVLSAGGNDLNAQTFGPIQFNPFNLNSSSNSYFAYPTAVDIDGDGDIDIVAGTYDGYLGLTKYYENTGNPTTASFAAPIENPFSIVTPSYLVFPTSADIDADGDQDLIIGGNYGAIDFLENIGNNTAPNFALPDSAAFGLSIVAGYAFPTFVDIDADGDLDAFVGEYYGNIQYFENIGSSSAPSFGSPAQNPFGLASGGGALACPTFADIDGDGDFDAFLVGDYYGNIVYAENIGTNTSPSFGVMVQSPFGLTASPNLLLGPNMIDLDNDGDLDLLAGNIYGAFVYYENTTSPLCPSPINLSSGNLTSTTADLVWTSSNAGVTYALEYGPKGFVPGTGTTVTGTSVVGVNTKTVTGITGSTLYEFYIKEDCGLGNLSSNVGPSVFSPVPVNDDCSNGAPISCGQIIQYTTIGAMSDNVVDCIVGNGSGGGVWYTIVGDGSTLKASLCASTFDTQIRVFTGTCSSLVCVTGNDDFCGLQSEVTWTSVNGTAYSILVYGFDNLEGNFTLNMCNAVVGIEDGEQLGKFKIFPNPAHDLLNVQWPGSTLSGPIKLEIFDAMGRSVYHANYPEHGSEGHYAETINVSNLLRGVYFVSILAGDQVISQKFIVE